MSESRRDNEVVEVYYEEKSRPEGSRILDSVRNRDNEDSGNFNNNNNNNPTEFLGRLKHGQETTPKQNVGMSELKLIAIGPDKYEVPTIAPLVSKVNEQLGRGAVIHKDYVSNDELTELYSGAKALVYISDREAFGLPPMEALSFGVPPVVADNKLGHELFGEYAFYSESGNVDDIAEAIKQALSDSEKIQKIKNSGPEFVKKYNWEDFANCWLKIINEL